MPKKLGHLEENHPKNSNLQKSTDCQKRCGLNDIVTLLVTFGSYKFIPNKKKSCIGIPLRVFSYRCARSSKSSKSSKSRTSTIPRAPTVSSLNSRFPGSPHRVSVWKLRIHHGFVKYFLGSRVYWKLIIECKPMGWKKRSVA